VPKRQVHLKVSKKILGYANPIVHDILDTRLPISEHRRSHNPETIILIGKLLGKDCEREAWLHFLMDYGLYREVKD